LKYFSQRPIPIRQPISSFSMSKFSMHAPPTSHQLSLAPAMMGGWGECSLDLAESALERSESPFRPRRIHPLSATIQYRWGGHNSRRRPATTHTGVDGEPGDLARHRQPRIPIIVVNIRRTPSQTQSTLRMALTMVGVRVSLVPLNEGRYG
jgi:hypothetical protein